MIKEIRISGFKRIESIVVAPERFNMFIGSNNSGKTSVLQALQLAIAASQTAKLNDSKWLDGKTRFSAPPDKYRYLPILDVTALMHKKTFSRDNGCQIQFIDESDGHTRSATISLRRGQNGNIVTLIEGEDLANELSSTDKPYCVYTPGISGINLSEERKDYSIMYKSATRGDSNMFLRNVIYNLSNDPVAWGKFTDVLYGLFPYIRLEVEYNPQKDETIGVFVIDNGVKLPIDALGTSVLQIMQIFSYYYFFQPQLLVLDEPDTHLHPDNQRRITRELLYISEATQGIESNTQILIATHSRHVLDELGSRGRIFWLQGGKQVPYTSTDQPKLLLDIGALDKGDGLINPSYDVVFCTEDSTKQEMLECIIKASGGSLDHIMIIPYYGCNKIDNVKTLAKFINKYSPGKKIILHRDRDYLSENEISNLKRECQRSKIKLFLTEGCDLEMIFLNAEHIHSLYPKVNVSDAQTLISQAIRDTEGTSKEKFKNYRSSGKDGQTLAEILTECDSIYDMNPSHYTYGKKACNLLRSKLQQQLKMNIDLFRTSEYIRQENIESLIR